LINYFNRWSIWNPFTWLSKNNGSIEEIESAMFQPLKTKCQRKYVYLRNGAIKIWTIIANNQAKTTPIVLMHDFGCGSALWLQNIGTKIFKFLIRI
jgi:hypothetical protein